MIDKDRSTFRSPGLIRVALVGLLIAAFDLGGCAYSYVDEDGRRRVIGLVDMTLPRASSPAPGDGAITEIRTIGLSVYRGPVDSHIALGYNASKIAAVPPNTVLHFGNFKPFSSD